MTAWASNIDVPHHFMVS